MWNKYFVILTGYLLLLSVGKFPCFGDNIDHQFPLGTLGCLFTGTRDFCKPGARCIDDLLFGTCSDSRTPGNFVYTLDKHDLTKLEQEIENLVKNKFSWRDGYTQCLIQNIIISLSIKQPFSKRICYSLIFDWEEPVKNEIRSVLGNLYKRTKEFDRLTSSQFEGVPLFSNSQKRDEIVRVHKYFDKSKSIHKRKFIDPYDNYLSYYPRDDIIDMEPTFYQQNYADSYAGQNIGGWENSGIPVEDLALVKSYLETTKSQPKYRSKLSDLFSNGPDLQQLTSDEGFYDGYPTEMYDLREDEQPGYTGTEGEDVYNLIPTETGKQTEVINLVDQQPMLQDDVAEDVPAALPPHLANILDKLIRGEVAAENLTDEELGFLTPYVTSMLNHLGDIDEDATDQDKLEAAVEEAMETDMQQEPENLPFGVDEEDMDMGADVDRREPMLDDSAEDVVNNEAQTERQFFEKKSSNGDSRLAVQKDDVVDTNFAFIEMNQRLTEQNAEDLIGALEKISSANPGSLNNYHLESQKLKINVDPVLAGLNASVLAQQARDHKLDLEKATGLKFEKAGIGSQTEVEISANDNQYFVLTFALCGCIAGILLAVVVIYLIRSNIHSKKKLQQIASAPAGNEAASKDYQDLCRQRMQSKSSEKPEPLHAASRVGSVSESQVKSPSSRSSTSSWSEEPVNSNMDISTGHIVLSYMEDHLKNKDRLEREWEAMVAYEADPSNTKVAEDQANARKNRYGDVLPYDHSRVVLSTNTNVSGSDFINASTIMDHDPRNPAYIATQGPLPHTVADFWQMVWEQGSVVIVMLTKLTENSEAKCHRYWPEEGSDLYHIYEVHLVSEHIWCDDYLVRSFYLKNLQTSETRTVTQFHFLTWPDLGVPGSIKALLDFRRKVNKSYRGRSCPIVVHCSDGCGRTGTYSLIDMVLNRMAKGAKEIDIAATLEHIRDQRMNMVKTKEQFQFALAAVAEEVHAILKALPQ